MSMTSYPTGPIRIGAVSYLNSKPLIERFRDHLPDADLRLDLPSRLADELSSGGLDVALIPSVEYLRGTGYVIASNACVATRGPVMSVKLYSRVHPGQIRRLAVDAGSRTSVALTQVILAHRYGVVPAVEVLPIECSVSDSDADAVLLIGDRAMHAPSERFHTVWDLGTKWLEWSGLPFVFAIWVARSESFVDEVAQSLESIRDAGVQSFDEIARREASFLGIGVEQATDYLKHNLHFRLGSAERQGLKLFQQLAGQLNLVPGEKDIVVRDQALVG